MSSTPCAPAPDAGCPRPTESWTERVRDRLEQKKTILRLLEERLAIRPPDPRPFAERLDQLDTPRTIRLIKQLLREPAPNADGDGWLAA